MIVFSVDDKILNTLPDDATIEEVEDMVLMNQIHYERQDIEVTRCEIA